MGRWCPTLDDVFYFSYDCPYVQEIQLARERGARVVIVHSGAVGISEVKLFDSCTSVPRVRVSGEASGPEPLAEATALLFVHGWDLHDAATREWLDRYTYAIRALREGDPMGYAGALERVEKVCPDRYVPIWTVP
ncbi:MAG: hypothetical protein IT406_01855 [Candidatus Yanofskybacteria bacterium]|nr:hypothetical protein [Candidatus Yanofskybacteria bacterium]